MATIVNNKTGESVDVPDEAAAQYVASGDYTLKGTITLPGSSQNVAVGPSDLGKEGVTPITTSQERADAAQARFDAEHNTLGSKAGAVLGGYLHWANEALPGTALRNELFDRTGIENPFASDIQAHPYLGHAAEAADVVGGLFVGGGEAKAAKAALEAKGAVEAPRVLTAAEKLAQAEDPVLLEHAASTLSSKAVYGGEAATQVETTLQRANGALDTATKLGERAGALPEDIAGMGMKELQAAEKTETAAVKAAREAARPQLATDITEFRSTLKEQKVFLATLNSEDSAIKQIGARAKKADFALDRMIEDPIGFAERPEQALTALRRQEAAYTELLDKHGDKLRAVFATVPEETTAAAGEAKTWAEFSKAKMGEYMKSEGGHAGAMKRLASEWKDIKAGVAAAPTRAAGAVSGSRRAQALDAIPQLLERNRALQARIGELRGPIDSPRLQAIRDAKELAQAGAAEKPTFLQKMVEGGVYGKVHAITTGIGAAVGGPLGAVIGVAAPAAAAKIGKYVTEKLFGRMASEGLKAAGRATSAVDALMSVAPKFAPAAKVLASEVLNNVRYAPNETKAPATKQPLAQAYNARAAEIRSQVAPNMQTGALELKPEARQAIADRIRALAGGSPLLADRIETLAARKIEYLANELPRQPDLGGLPLGPNKWQPSEMQMREFARKVSAVEDPHAVIERLAAGTITTEDRDALRAVYPEMYNDVVRQVMERLPALRTQLPFQKRLAMSVFTGVPVDASCSPVVLASLQSNYSSEPNTQGGVMPPKPQPAFGSVRSLDKATPAQRRAAGETAV